MAAQPVSRPRAASMLRPLSKGSRCLLATSQARIPEIENLSSHHPDRMLRRSTSLTFQGASRSTAARNARLNSVGLLLNELQSRGRLRVSVKS